MRLQTTESNKSIKSKSKTKNQSKKIVESLPYKIKDIALAKLGRDKIDISEKEIEDLKLFKTLLGMKFEDLNKMNINRESRKRILNKIIDYYSLHLQMFKTPKSINVFAEVFK